MVWVLQKRRLDGALPTDRLFPFSQEKLLKWFQAACAFLHLDDWKFSLYCCRHGGPSEDIARKQRSWEEVRQRGRCQVPDTMLRYQHRGRLHVVLSRCPEELRQFCRCCEVHLFDLITQPRRLARPKLSHAFIVPAAVEGE